MQKKYSFTLFLLLGATGSFGQVRFGIQGSGQIASFKLIAPSDLPALATFETNFFKPIVGFRAGIMADIRLKDKWALRPQLLYAARGSKFDFSHLSTVTGVDLNDFNSTLDYHYLEIPVLVTYSLKIGVGQVVAGTGPYVAYLLSASESTIKSRNKVQANLANGDRLDYGLTASAGYELPGGLTLSAYYLLGLANMSTGVETPNTISGSVNAYNRTFGLTVGYFFGAGN
ncbi:porin family protein [Fibrella sp. WM1]|uniref:porin family protein n=1 Tax=Fibrella musci TaxID=3242485 RepID=UPI003521B54E